MFKAKVSGTGWLCIESEDGKLHAVTQLTLDQHKEIREYLNSDPQPILFINNDADEVVEMNVADFVYDTTSSGLPRWTHLHTEVTAVRQPYMSNAQWYEHCVAKIKEARKLS